MNAVVQLAERDRVHGRREPLGGVGHQRAVEGARDLQPDHLAAGVADRARRRRRGPRRGPRSPPGRGSCSWPARRRPAAAHSRSTWSSSSLSTAAMPPPAPAAALIRPRSCTSREQLVDVGGTRRGQRRVLADAVADHHVGAQRRCRPSTARSAASDAAISAGCVISVRESCSSGPSKQTARTSNPAARPARSNTPAASGNASASSLAHAHALAALAREAERDLAHAPLLCPLHHARSPGQAAAEADHQHDVARRRSGPAARPRPGTSGSIRRTCCRIGQRSRTPWLRPAPAGARHDR